ncbi:hypothetical protein D3C85_1477660 [compost metagenome]
MVKSFCMLEAVAKGAVNQNVEEPDKGGEKERLAIGADIECNEHYRSNKTVAEVVNYCTNSRVYKVAGHGNIGNQEEDWQPPPVKVTYNDIKNGY